MMVCNRFQECLETTRILEGAKIYPKTNKKKKAKRLEEKNKSLYSDPACGNQNIQKKCIAFFDRRSQPSCTEKGKTYTLNQSATNFQVLCFHIDGGVINSPECNKCDYAFFLKDNVDGGKGRAVFIELKGKNIRHAMKQLNETLSLDAFKDVSSVYKKIYGRIVVTSSIPRLQSDDDFIELKERFIKLGGNLKIGEMNFVEQFDNLDNMK